MKRMIAALLFIFAVLLSLASCFPSPLPEEMPENFSFSIKFGTFGYSSYDSESGILVKDRVATNPEDYTTTYIMSEEDLSKVYELICGLNITGLPDEIPDSEILGADPYLTLSLTVCAGDTRKTVTANQVGGYDSGITPRAKKYLEVSRAIVKIIQASEEWKALPDYEFLYD